MEGSLLRVEILDKVAVVTVDNPPLNLLKRVIHEDLIAVCTALASDATVAAVVVTGDGERAFSAGADVSGVSAAPPAPDNVRATLSLECRAFDAIEGLPQPTVAAIFGHTLGGGLELSLACDFRIAAESLQAGLPEARLGWFPASGSLVRLAKLIGQPAAKRMAILGEPIDAGSALSLGLVDEVVAPAAVKNRAVEFASELAVPKADAVRAIKQILNADSGRFHAQDVELILNIAADQARVSHETSAPEAGA
jgi:enoyl-CoA hydratase/carnithine racemase